MNKKKIVSLALALVLAVGVLAGTASATDATTQAVLDMAEEAYGPDTLVCMLIACIPGMPRLVEMIRKKG